jgi:ABC-type glycerol-3-phosphate transport system substrate-binding protein
MKKSLSLLLLFILISSLFGCRLKGTTEETPENIELVFYGLYDDSEIYDPIIKEFENKNTNVTITYKQFTDVNEYEQLIVNELAEGKGPDIFSIHNTWLAKHQNKIIPAPDTISAADFRDVFVSVCADDLIRVDSTDNTEKVYALPLFVDSLALYYNKKMYEDVIPERGKPPTTWEELKDDVYKLTKADDSFEKFQTAGIAMGRSDNILRANDIFYMLMLQNGVQFYNDDYSSAIFANSQDKKYLASEALDLYTSFGIENNKNYSWNDTISDPSSSEKEIIPFVKGKVAMIIGYSYLYNEIKNQIDVIGKKENAISSSDVKIASIPQIFDPKKDSSSKAAYADYFAETVSRNSKNPDIAWEFLDFLVSKENAKYYHEKTNRPTARRDLIDEQKQEPNYGIFASQSGFAKSYLIYDDQKYSSIFSDAISSVITGSKSDDSLKKAQTKVNDILPGDILSTLKPKEEKNN